MIRRAILLAELATLWPAAAYSQSATEKIDAGHSYATIWMGLNSEVSVAVNTGVAQAGGRARLAPEGGPAATLEFALVPGGAGAELLSPEGTIRAGQIAAIARYMAMAFRSTSSRVRRDGLLEFTGALTITYVTRQKIMAEFNLSYSGSTTYTDPVVTTVTREAHFAVLTPQAEFLLSYLKEDKEVIVAATLDAKEFPELPDMVLSSDWPLVAQDEKCATGTIDEIRRDYGGYLCTGKAIAVTNPPAGPPPSTSRDYSGQPRPPVPMEGPVTIVLHLRFSPSLSK